MVTILFQCATTAQLTWLNMRWHGAYLIQQCSLRCCLEDFACGSSSNCGKENGVVVQVDSAVEDDVPIWSGIIAGAI